MLTRILIRMAGISVAVLITASFCPAACWSGTTEGCLATIPNDPEPVAIRSWLVAGPFPSPNLPDSPPDGPHRSGYSTDFLTSIGGEESVRAQIGAAVTTPDGEQVEFSIHEWEEPYLDLNQIFDLKNQVCVYLYGELGSEVEQEVFLHVGTNAAGKVWLGDRLVAAHPGDRVAERSQYVARVRLQAGRTPLLLKIDHDGGGWGAFVEVYGPTAQREFVRENFPRHLELGADNYLPNAGDKVTVLIANWIPAEPPISVVWTVRDGDGTQTLAEDSSESIVTIASGPQRVIRLRATAAHPQGGKVTGEGTLLTGGEASAKQTIARLETAQNEIEDPLALTGARRDAYAQALYRLERIQRENPHIDLKKINAEMGKSIALMRVALDELEARANPYDGKTSKIEAAYLSEADGTAQPFMLFVPAEYAPQRSYALQVYLHGAGQIHEVPTSWWRPPADEAYHADTIGVGVTGRGRYGGYAGLAEDDVFQAIKWVKSRYSIDPDRITIQGSSMGGFGTWRIASQYPDLFAAATVDCGGPYVRTLPNLIHLPTYVNQGELDWGIVGHARTGVDLMKRFGCPVVYNEYPGVDHAVGVVVTPQGYLTRLAPHGRVTDPDRIRIHATHPRYSKMYWGCIEAWNDPHKPAKIEAKILPGNVVSLHLTNVAKARITPPPRHLSGKGDIVWMVEGRRLTTPRTPEGAYDIVVADGEPAVGPHVDENLSETRPYVQGSFMELYRGEPLLVVYGTQAQNESLLKAIREMAERASGWLAPYREMEFGRVPMIADKDVTDRQLASKNLFLIGGPKENSVTARLMSQMPIREENGSLGIFDSEPVPLGGKGYGLVYPNPEHPARLVFVFASSVPEFYGAAPRYGPAQAGASRMFLLDDYDPYIPDLIVEEVEPSEPNRIVRMVPFTHGWRPKPVVEKFATRHPKSKLELEEMLADVYRDATGAPYAIVRSGSSQRPYLYNPATMGWIDISMLLADRDLIVFNATGKELLDLSEPAQGKLWRFSPAPDPASIDPEETYEVATFIDALWGLGQSHYTPPGVRVVADGDRFEAVARKVWGVKER